jgi:hypothetical protein
MLDEPYLTTKAAIGADEKRVQERLGTYSSYVRQMLEGPKKDRYTRFLLLYHAVSDAGAEIYFSDFQRRHFERMAGSKERPKDETTIIEDVLQLTADFNSAAYNKDDAQIIKKGSRLINAIGDLMALARKQGASYAENAYDESQTVAAR